MRNFKIRSGFFRSVLFLVLFNFVQTTYTNAAPLYFEPVTKRLPDGTTLTLFVSGDEFFNYLHDTNGFPVGTGHDGYYYYLIQKKDDFLSTPYRVGLYDPFKIDGIRKVTIPSYVAAKRNSYQKQMDEASAKIGIRSHNKSSGIFNNLVIYIRFLNEPDFTIQRSAYEAKFNNLTGTSLRYYYKEVSYNKIDIISYNFPGGSTQNVYYTDSNTRSYYQPYNASTNPAGYNGDTDRALREHSLLANAINWSAANYSLPEGVNFDLNEDGIFDNVCFIIRGSSDGWSDLLWPHSWALYSKIVKIGGLRVYGYTLQMENVSVNTLSHEMFHALGAPDLYHYDNSERPVGPWDIMANGSCHPGAWMKYKYGGWIDSVSEIRESGTYNIKPLTQAKNNCYLIRSPYRNDQFFVLEFRKKTGTYEINVPASGLILQRIDTRYRGNSGGPPDEIYVFRKNGGPGIAGDINSAVFSDLYGRTVFNDSSNPYAFFQDGTKTGIDIFNIVSMGDSISFSVDIDRPLDLILSPIEDSQISGSWKSLSRKESIVAFSSTPDPISPVPGKVYSVGDTIGRNGIVIQKSTYRSFDQRNLISDEPYYYTVWTVLGNNPVSYSLPLSGNTRTGIYSVRSMPFEENFDGMTTELPRGWKSKSGTSDWQLFTSSPFSFPNSVLLLNPQHNADEWFYTPGFELLTPYKYMITFRYRNVSPGVVESFFLNCGYDRYNNGISLYNLFSSANFSLNEYAIFKALFTPAYSTTFYFGFKTGIAGQGVLLDDFRIEKVPAKTKQHSEPEEFYPNPTSGSITVPSTGKTEISVFRTDGIKIFETQIESMQEIDLSSLGTGMFLIRFSDNNKTVTRKIIIL
jgi:M6 family metalloprotease-like protein